MTTILTSVLLFGVLSAVLIAVLLAAEALLVPGGTVAVRVNDRTVTLRRGVSLLDALAEQKIFLPAACGGQGTCGRCKVRVREGGRAPVATERALVTYRDRRVGYRLACQLKVRNPMTIEMAPEIVGVRKLRCTVVSRQQLAPFIREIVFALPEGEEFRVEAGGYVQLTCPPYCVRYSDLDVLPEYEAEWTRYEARRHVSTVTEPATRAYSLANHAGERGIVMLDVRLALPPPGVPDAPPGQVSSYLFSLAPGEQIDVSGPFGHFHTLDTDAEMVFVGGGAGMAPMRAHILDLLEGRGSRRRISFWYGARARQDAFYVELFDRLEREHDNFTWRLVLSDPRPDDRWEGPVGFVHQVLFDEYLKGHDAPEDCEYYLCGPPVMVRACRRMLTGLGVDREHVLFDDFGV
ncbi:MAG: NADH:ubiquinone reductase (Na(+)-transporting) subunit F [Planctomycetota bacterium]